MSNHKPQPPERPDDSRSSSLLLGPGLVLVVICCAGPALVAAGGLGAIGAWLANPWVIGAAIAVLAVAVTWTVRRRRRASKTDAGGQPERPHQPGLPRASGEDQ